MMIMTRMISLRGVFSRKGMNQARQLTHARRNDSWFGNMPGLNSVCNIRRHIHSNIGGSHANNNVSVGLYGCSSLLSPEDFNRTASATIFTCLQLKDQISEACVQLKSKDITRPDAGSSDAATADVAAFVVMLLDRISNEVCMAIDMFEATRNIHEQQVS